MLTTGVKQDYCQQSDSSSDYDSDGCKDVEEDSDDDNDGILDDSDNCSKGTLNWISILQPIRIAMVVETNK